MKTNCQVIILVLISCIVQSCSSDQEIRALYSNRPCSQSIIMTSKAECEESKCPDKEPVNGLTMEGNLEFDHPEIAPCPVYKKIEIHKWQTAIYFDYKKHDLSTDAIEKLNQNLIFFKTHPKFQLSVRGFTDSRGNILYNKRLANRRVSSVVNYMVRHQINKNRMILSPVGETAPLLPNVSEENMAINRRVEMLLINPEGRPASFILYTPEIRSLFDPEITQDLFCTVWAKRIQWFPDIFFTSKQVDLNPVEMKALTQDIQVMKEHSDVMVSMREFSISSPKKKQQENIALKRLQLLEKSFRSHSIQKNRIQVIAPEETQIFKTFDSRHHSNDHPCVELLLLDHKARPIPLVVVTEKNG